MDGMLDAIRAHGEAVDCQPDVHGACRLCVDVENARYALRIARAKREEVRRVEALPYEEWIKERNA